MDNRTLWETAARRVSGPAYKVMAVFLANGWLVVDETTGKGVNSDTLIAAIDPVFEEANNAGD